jgi:hypothetical protein
LTAVVALLFIAIPCRGQSFSADPVAELQKALKAVGQEPRQRESALKPPLEALRQVNDIRRALVLAEWRDEDLDTEIASVDLSFRTMLAQRFQAVVREGLRSGNAETRRWTLNLLLDGDTTLRDVLVKTGVGRRLASDLGAFMDAVPELRCNAAAALARINLEPDVSVPIFSRLLASKDSSERLAGANGLLVLIHGVSHLAVKSRAVRQPRATQLDVIRTGRAAVLAAGHWLNDSQPEIRRLSMAAIAEAAAALCRLVVDPAPPVVEFDATAARQRQAKERVELLPLILALKDQGPDLVRGLRDSDAGVRISARRALEDMAIARHRLAQQPESSVVSLLSQDPPPFPTRGEGASSITKGEAAVASHASPSVPGDPLLEALGAPLTTLATGVYDPDVRVRLGVIDILEALGPAAAPAARPLVRALTDPDHFVRWAAARTLGKVGAAEPVAVPALERLLDDPDVDVRLAAAVALEHYGQAASVALPGLIRSLKSSNAEERVAVIRALRSIGPDSRPAIPAVTMALADPDARVRQLAAELLGRFSPDNPLSSELPPQMPR